MRKSLLACFLLFTVSSHTFAIESVEGIVFAKDWPAEARVQDIAQLPAVQKIISNFDEHDLISITIYYPGGAAGIKWATELQNWLVALGIPLSYSKLALGSGGANQLRLQLVNRQ